MNIYLKPTGSPDQPYEFDYATNVRSDYGPEIVTAKSPSLGTFWLVVDGNAEPSEHPLYTATFTIDFTDDASPTHPHFKHGIKTWSQLRKPQAEIDALLDQREERVESGLIARAVARLVKTDDVLLEATQALVNASTLGAGAKQAATDAITARKQLNDQMLAAIQALQAETQDWKNRTAQGEDITWV